MATSETEICNLALSRLGQKRQITSLTEQSVSADLCRLHYALSRDAVLKAHPWNFATQRAELAQDATAPAFEYAYRYALPSAPDYCLKVVRTSLEADGIADDYRVEGRFLLSNEGSVKIEYIKRVTDVAQFDDMFVDVLAERLAAEMAMPLTDNASLTKAKWDTYRDKLPEARTSDAQEGTPRVFEADDWLTARA